MSTVQTWQIENKSGRVHRKNANTFFFLMWNDYSYSMQSSFCDYTLFQSDSSAITEEKDDDMECMFDGKLDFMAMPGRALDKAEEIARRVWLAGWTVVHHQHLPKWLRDNDFLIKGHRPPLNSFYACFKSIFRIHTETGNIWTHLLGKLASLTIVCLAVAQR